MWLEEQRALLKNALQALEEQDDLGREAQSVVTLDQQSVGRLSRQDALLNQSMAKATQARRNAEKLRLSAALARMDEGEYGLCTDCGDEIDRRRLALDPAAPRCMSCAAG